MVRVKKHLNDEPHQYSKRLFDLIVNLNQDQYTQLLLEYGKCPKISYTKVADKMPYANTADPDQTAPEGAVCSQGLHCLPFHYVF